MSGPKYKRGLSLAALLELTWSQSQLYRADIASVAGSRSLEMYGSGIPTTSCCYTEVKKSDRDFQYWLPFQTLSFYALLLNHTKGQVSTNIQIFFCLTFLPSVYYVHAEVGQKKSLSTRHNYKLMNKKTRPLGGDTQYLRYQRRALWAYDVSWCWSFVQLQEWVEIKAKSGNKLQLARKCKVEVSHWGRASC